LFLIFQNDSFAETPISAQYSEALNAIENTKNVMRKGSQQFNILKDFYPALSKKIEITSKYLSNYASEMKIAEPSKTSEQISDLSIKIMSSSVPLVQATNNLVASLENCSQKIGVSENSKQVTSSLADNLRKYRKEEAAYKYLL